jgi:hypothetical protein
MHNTIPLTHSLITDISQCHHMYTIYWSSQTHTCTWSSNGYIYIYTHTHSTTLQRGQGRRGCQRTVRHARRIVARPAGWWEARPGDDGKVGVCWRGEAGVGWQQGAARAHIRGAGAWTRGAYYSFALLGENNVSFLSTFSLGNTVCICILAWLFFVKTMYS